MNISKLFGYLDENSDYDDFPSVKNEANLENALQFLMLVRDNKEEILQWLDSNDIDYSNMSELDIYITFLKNKFK